MELYDQKHIQNWYNEYAEQETQRWEKSIIEKVKLHLHLHYLNRYIAKGDQILELGAGTGMFTKALAKLSSNLTVTDLSPVQLQLNKKNAEAGKYSQRIKTWEIQDICDLSNYQNNAFDKVLCYGGPLSYVFEKKGVALKEIKRVLKPGGIALISVMNLWGTAHEYLAKIIIPTAPEDNEKVISTGNLHPSGFTPSDHHCHMFRSEELKKDILEAGFELLVLSASNCLSASKEAELEILIQDQEKWNYFLDVEVRACQSPGMVESGTHIIAVIKK